MKYGAHAYLWADQWSDSALDLLDRARALGLDYIELSNGDDVHFTPRLTRARAAALGMDLVLSPGGHWPMNYDISLEDAADRQRGVEWHKRSLELAAEIGAIAYAGAMYAHPGHIIRRRPTTEDYRRTAEGVHTLAAYGARLGVTLVLEPMSHFRTWLVNSPHQLMQLIALADHTNIGVLFDTYHMVTEIRDYPEALRTAAPRLWGLHACENDRGIPGGGLIPWQAISATVQEIGFDGYVAMESYNSGTNGFAARRGLFHDPCPDGDVFVRQGLAFLRGIFKNETI